MWPPPTHGRGRALPYVTAADCIDWSIRCPSISTRNKPLADATMHRIARGIRRYVLDAAQSFNLPDNANSALQAIGDPLPTVATGHGRNPLLSPTIMQCANASANGVAAGGEPLGTVTAWPKGGAHAVVSAVLCGVGGRAGDSEARSVDQPGYTTTSKADCALVAATMVQTGEGERPSQHPRVPGIDTPIGTLVDGQKHAAISAALVKFRGESSGADLQELAPSITSGAGAARPAGAAHALGMMTVFLEQANGGGPSGKPARARGAEEPVSSITGTGSQQRLVTANMITMQGENTGAAADTPVRTLSAGGEHHAVIECQLSAEHQAGALQVAAFLLRYYGEGGQWGGLTDPTHAITTKDRLALVTVTIRGTPYVIVDIGLRMLQRHELFRAQGFPTDYIIDRTADGRSLSISLSVAMVGNSVSPPPHRALVQANCEPADVAERIAA